MMQQTSVDTIAHSLMQQTPVDTVPAVPDAPSVPAEAPYSGPTLQSVIAHAELTRTAVLELCDRLDEFAPGLVSTVRDVLGVA